MALENSRKFAENISTRIPSPAYDEHAVNGIIRSPQNKDFNSNGSLFCKINKLIKASNIPNLKSKPAERKPRGDPINDKMHDI